jgi:hypothetical protein
VHRLSALPYHDVDVERQQQCCKLPVTKGTPGCVVRGWFVLSLSDGFVQVHATSQADAAPLAAVCSPGEALGHLAADSNSAQKHW